MMMRTAPALVSCWLLALSVGTARASIAYGSTNNFDTVNDTGTTCHGFEIELDDIHSTAITSTYDYNHYGVPKITEDDTTPGHPKVIVRYQAVYTSGTWSAFTAIPSGPIAPTMGHQFTNPSVNFGGEHFGVGYNAPPSAVIYDWLVDNGSGVLIHGGAVNVATPVFNYAPAVGAAPAAVQAVIVPPPPPAPPPLEFGAASWVKEIRTTTHSNQPVKIEDLVSKDPDYPNAKNWTNNEPDEVEVEWQILQTDSGAGNGGANGSLAGAAENLSNSDEVVTRRYEFYKYTGPLDTETGEALAQTVAPDGLYGTGTAQTTTGPVDLTKVQVVGAFVGAQMSGFNAGGKIDLIDHLQDGQVGVAYVNRTVVIPGSTAFQATTSGTLPPGTTLDSATGIFSGTPSTSGLYTFSVTATDLNNATVKKDYTVAVAAANGALPAQSTITAGASAGAHGSTAGSGNYYSGTEVTVAAIPALGYGFANWTENGVVVSTSSSYTFTVGGNRALIANFSSGYSIATSVLPLGSGTTTGDGNYIAGASVTVTATPYIGYVFTGWSQNGVNLSSSSSYLFTSNSNISLLASFSLASPVLTATSTGTASSSGSVLDDTVNPNGVATVAYYRYGTTANYGATTGTQSLGSGTSAVIVTGTLSGLQPATTYYFQLVTSGSAGTFYGPVQTFATQPVFTLVPEAFTKEPAPGISNALFASIGNPAINSMGHVAFQATVTGTSTSAGINPSNNSGIWADDATGTRQLVAQTGTTVAPGTMGAVFAALDDPVYNNNHAVAFLGTLKLRVSDARSALNNAGIWSNDGGSLHLVARMGAPAPGCPLGVAFASVSQLALPDQGGASNQGGVVFLAALTAKSGITPSNNQGIWAVDTSGILRLILRKGDAPKVNGVSKTITAMAFLNAPAYVSGQTRSFDQNTGDLLVNLAFKDGSKGVVKVVFP